MQQKGIRNSDSSANPKIINIRQHQQLQIDTNTNIKPHQHPFRNYQNQGE